jgi:hypothetical protein
LAKIRKWAVVLDLTGRKRLAANAQGGLFTRDPPITGNVNLSKRILVRISPVEDQGRELFYYKLSASAQGPAGFVDRPEKPPLTQAQARVWLVGGLQIIVGGNRAANLK